MRKFKLFDVLIITHTKVVWCINHHPYENDFYVVERHAYRMLDLGLSFLKF